MSQTASWNWPQAEPRPGGPALPRISPWTLLGGGFVLAAGALLIAGRTLPALNTLSITFVSIVLEALPFVAIGALVGGLVETFVSRERLAAVLPGRTRSAIFVAAGLGLLLPVCECAIIPVTRRLVRKGVPFCVAVAYLLAGPIVNPLVALSTYVAYAGDWSVVLARLVFGYGIAVFVAMMMNEFFCDDMVLIPETKGEDGHHKNHHGHNHHDCGCGNHGCSSHGHQTHRSFHGKLVAAMAHAGEDFLYVGQFLIIGAFVAAGAQTLLDRAFFVTLASTPVLGIGGMMTLAVLLNLCSEADAFVAASFRTAMPLSAQLAFMVLGPMLDLKLIAMYLSFVRRGAFTVLVILMVGSTFALMWLFEIFTAPAG